uniref:Uncharacterized protein n=1 Tax=Moniliophthora roreri TaxID=221103 RepID=A0A0W0F071_MONRR
MSLSSFAIP